MGLSFSSVILIPKDSWIDLMSISFLSLLSLTSNDANQSFTSLASLNIFPSLSTISPFSATV